MVITLVVVALFYLAASQALAPQLKCSIGEDGFESGADLEKTSPLERLAWLLKKTKWLLHLISCYYKPFLVLIKDRATVTIRPFGRETRPTFWTPWGALKYAREWNESSEFEDATEEYE